jgi:hypothetical protein
MPKELLNAAVGIGLNLPGGIIRAIPGVGGDSTTPPPAPPQGGAPQPPPQTQEPSGPLRGLFGR